MKRENVIKKLSEAKIGVLMGGLSNEREISLKSGLAVMESLKRIGLPAVGIDMDRDICARLKNEKIDFAFIALHGRYGEDGSVQGALELMGIPYTGAGVTASALAMDKVLSKIVAKDCGAKIPEYHVIHKQSANGDLARLDMKAPLVVKPVSCGSSIGVSICHDDNEIENGVKKALESDDRVLVEKFVDGKLVTVGIIGQKALPVVEIETGKGFYDFDHKYAPGDTEYHIPARLEPAALSHLSEISLNIHRAFGVRGMSRSEFIVDDAGTAWFLELNTIPGLTKTSLLPKSAQKAGLSFDDMVLAIFEEAFQDE